MTDQPPQILTQPAQIETWAVLSLFGHTQLAGRIEWENGLLRIDIPTPDGYRTKYIGSNAIFEMDIVSESIARAAVPAQITPRALDIPIVSREQYEETVNRQNQQLRLAERTIRELQNRLTTIDAAPLLQKGTPPDCYPDYIEY